MIETPAFPELLALIERQSAVLRAAVATVPDLDTAVPGCPDWSLTDLVAHVGEVQRFWAAAVAAGPAEHHPSAEAVGDTLPGGDLLTWSAESTERLLAALRAAGPEQGCWAWWGGSTAPLTAGAVARHQVQEAAVHAFDAQEAAGHPQPIPAVVALDGVGEFLTVTYGSCGPWPHRPARLGLRATEGRSWLLDLTPSGAVLLPAGDGDGGWDGIGDGDGEPPTAVLEGPASDLVLALYARVPLDRLRIEGDRALVAALVDWPPLG